MTNKDVHNFMRKSIIFLVFIVSAIVSTFANMFPMIITAETAQAYFVSFRSLKDATGLKMLIEVLENSLSDATNAELMTILAEAILEYAIWGLPEGVKLREFEKARKYAEQAIKLDGTNGKAWFVTALAISRIIPYKDPVTKLLLLREFDRYNEQAIELLDDPLYKALAFMGSAIRFREPPWPLNNYEESQRRFQKAIEYAPDLPNIYFEFGLLYLKMGNKIKAREMFLKVTELPAHPLFLKAHEELLESAKQELDKLK